MIKLKEAMFYEKKENNLVQCHLCPHHCTIKKDNRGKCGVRENIEGTLYSLNYGKTISLAVDPIEKKPLFHFMPGTHTLSMATTGCNMSCEFCQNWEISQQPKPKQQIIGKEITPEEIVEEAELNKCKSISYTYTEPTIFFEYAFDTAKLAHDKGIKNVFVTNGFITKQAIDKISKYLDAVNIDLKGFTDDYYRDICGASFKPILEAIKRYYQNGIFVEITTLIVPGHNDDKLMLKKMAEFIKSIDDNIPWHISRFHPSYKMQDTLNTNISAIHKAVEEGKKAGLKYIYAGNIPGDDYENTCCPKCGEKVIERRGFFCDRINLDKNRCKSCGTRINIV